MSLAVVFFQFPADLLIVPYRLSDRQIDRKSKGMQGHLLGPLKKIFYIKSEVYDRRGKIAIEKR